MKNKLLLFGLFFALLQATVYGKRNEPDPSIIDEPLNINVDAGKERDNFTSLAKIIEEEQSLIDDARKRMSTKIVAAEDRWNQRMTAEAKATEDRWNQRMTAEAKATEERWTQRMTAEAKATEERWNQRLAEAIKTTEGRMSAEITQLNKTVVELSNQLAKSRYVTTPLKRPAELACEKITKDLRSIGETTFDGMPYSGYYLYYSDNQRKFCRGALIDKRFLITATSCVSTGSFTKVVLGYHVESGIKEIHIHPDFSSETPSFNNIALIELDSDVDYAPKRFPVCLYASQVIPESDLAGFYRKVQIVTDTECFNKTGTVLKASQICAKNLKYHRTFSGMPIYEVQENFTKHKLFGIVATDSRNMEPYVITKVFDHLDFIESIVWPKSGN